MKDTTAQILEMLNQAQLEAREQVSHEEGTGEGEAARAEAETALLLFVEATKIANS